MGLQKRALETVAGVRYFEAVLTAVEDHDMKLALRRTPAGTGAASAAAVRRAGKLLPVLAQHLFDGSNPSRQTEALK